jgi:hypothetical protein
VENFNPNNSYFYNNFSYYKMLLARLIFESFSFAYGSLTANKLRTFLSLLGITIGIFAIISVFTVIDSLERYIRNSLNSLGSNMVYIQKWPWTPPEGETEYPWWRYLNRPVPDLDETFELEIRSMMPCFFMVSAGPFNRVPTRLRMQRSSPPLLGCTMYGT